MTLSVLNMALAQLLEFWRFRQQICYIGTAYLCLAIHLTISSSFFELKINIFPLINLLFRIHILHF